MGYLYKKKWKDDKTGSVYEGNIWWIQYYRNGKVYRESSKTELKSVAEKILKQREGEIAQGKLPGVHFDKVTFEELAADYITDYEVNLKDTLKKAKRSVKHLKSFFGGMSATDITSDKIKEYTKKRLNQGMANASINRELAALKRMFNLGAQCTPPKVNLIPHIPMLKESNVRKGFFERGEYLAIKQAAVDLGFDFLKSLIVIAYHTAWRDSEIRNLTWDKVDLHERIIRLDPGETKGEEGRLVYLDGELLEEIKLLRRNMVVGCPYVVHRNGNMIKDFREAWKTTCIKAGLCEVIKDELGKTVVVKDKKGNEKVVKAHTKIFHDFRRTGVRNMIRAGVPETVAMRISGHKTRSVFDRYNIVSEKDLQDAARKQRTYYENQEATEPIERGEILPFNRAQNE